MSKLYPTVPPGDYTKKEFLKNLEKVVPPGDYTKKEFSKNLEKVVKMSSSENIVNIAKNYIGKKEKKGNMGFQDPVFEEKMKKVGFIKGHAWCSYFAELVWKEAFLKSGINNFKVLDKLFSASTQTTWRNFAKNGKDNLFEVFDKPFPGDLVVWRSKSNSALGHIGIVVSEGENGYFYAIEGNTNDKGGREGYIVAKRKRILSFSKNKPLILLGFIRYVGN